MDKQTLLKILPCPKLRLRVVVMGESTGMHSSRMRTAHLLSSRGGEVCLHRLMSFTGRQVVGQVKKVGKTRNFHQEVGKSRNISTKK